MNYTDRLKHDLYKLYVKYNEAVMKGSSGEVISFLREIKIIEKELNFEERNYGVKI